MILKGNQRGNGSDLAVHLMNRFDNERVNVAEIRGSVAGDLMGAFAEFEATAEGTKCTQPLYSLSINPPSPITRDQYDEAISLIERKLGLEGQPRAIVFHEKYGREHAHVVWSRIDAAKMKAIPMSHDHRKLCDLACELARRFNLELPPGLKAWEKDQPFRKEKLEPTLAEKAQALDTGITPEQRRSEITKLYEQSDSGEAFRSALEQQGYILAKGDRRGFVVVDKDSSVHNLSRYIKGHTAKKIAAKLAPLTPEHCPDVEQAKAMAKARMDAVDDRKRGERRIRLEELREAVRQALEKQQMDRRRTLASREQELLTRQAAERMALHAAQLTASKGVLFKVRSAFETLIEKMPALRSVLTPIQKKLHLDPKERQAQEGEALLRRHGREKLDIERERRYLGQIEQREAASFDRWMERAVRVNQSLENTLRQDFFDAARDHAIRHSELFGSGDLSGYFNEASGIVRDVLFDGEEGMVSPSWKSPAKKRSDDQESEGLAPKQGRGYGYRRGRDDEPNHG